MQNGDPIVWWSLYRLAVSALQTTCSQVKRRHTPLYFDLQGTLLYTPQSDSSICLSCVLVHISNLFTKDTINGSQYLNSVLSYMHYVNYTAVKLITSLEKLIGLVMYHASLFSTG